VTGEDAQLNVYAGAILLATLIQLFLPVPWLRGLDGRLQLVLDWRDPAVRRFFKLMLPVTLTLGLINMNAVVDTVFASRFYPDLGPTAINSAFRLYMLPQGMFSVAVATVLFPALARYAARNDLAAFRATVSTGLRQIAFLLIPASIVSAVLAEPIVRLVYERGEFTAGDVTVVAACLAAFSLGLVFNGWMLMLSRGFYGLQSNWVPTMVGVGTLCLNAVLDVALYRVGIWGIPLATSFVNIVGTALLVFYLRRRVGGVDLARIADAVVRVTGASMALGAVSFGVWYGLDQALGRSIGAQIVSLALALGVGALVYIAACRMLRVRETDALRQTISRRSV
jgi:putative peptidoglycan lipid II flippase